MTSISDVHVHSHSGAQVLYGIQRIVIIINHTTLLYQDSLMFLTPLNKLITYSHGN